LSVYQIQSNEDIIPKIQDDRMSYELTIGIMAQVWHYGTGVVLDGNSSQFRLSE